MADRELVRSFMKFCEEEMGWKFVDVGGGNFVVEGDIELYTEEEDGKDAGEQL